jgi:tripartite-type tricarboxylate transporter receptor subunit TctC
VNWFGLFAPAKTPRPIINRVNAALVKTVKSPELQAQFIALGADPVGSTVEEFTAFVKRDMEKYEKVVRISGAKVD